MSAMKKLLLALCAASLSYPAAAADRSSLGNPLGVVPVVSLPLGVPALPGSSAILPSGLALPGLPTLAPAAAPAAALASAPGAQAQGDGAKAPDAKTPAAQPQLAALAQGVSGEGAGASGPAAKADDAIGALSSAFDGAKSLHSCAHCAHADDDHGDFPTDTQGNPFIVAGHLDPLLPSHMDPKTWTGALTLHLHSHFSDGTMTPAAVMDLAYSKGVRDVALSDHDTTAGILSAWKRAKELGMSFHPSAELTARGGVHIGAVDLDISNPELVALLARVRAMRYAKAAGMVANLNALPELVEKGIVLTIDEVKAHSQHDAGGTIEIPHIARVLLDKGLIKTVDEAFDKYLKGDIFKTPGVEEDPTVDEVLAVIKAAGGKAFLNHPYTVRGKDDAEKDRNVVAILDKGVDGIEVYRPSHAESPDGKRRADQRAAKYLTWIDERGLLAGNGADFHGTDTHLDTLVVWMPKILAAQLQAGLKDANARALAVLERLDGSAPVAPKTPPSKLSGFILAPALAMAADNPWNMPIQAWMTIGFFAALAIFITGPLKAMDEKSPRLATLISVLLALGFAGSFYAFLLAKIAGG
jgi:predicted metal-dependent phosphoesterase TrpH